MQFVIFEKFTSAYYTKLQEKSCYYLLLVYMSKTRLEGKTDENFESTCTLFVIFTHVTWECTHFQPIRSAWFFHILYYTLNSTEYTCSWPSSPIFSQWLSSRATCLDSTLGVNTNLKILFARLTFKTTGPFIVRRDFILVAPGRESVKDTNKISILM